MALGTFIAGRYSATWDPPGATGATDLGIMREGYTVMWSLSVEPINNTDAYGDMWIDDISRGITDCFIECEGIEWKTGPLLAATPLEALSPTGSDYLAPGVIGRLGSDLAGATILTATTATPAASTPATLTATYSKLAENFPVRLLANSKLRTVPLKLRVYPYLDSVIKFLVVT